MARTVIMRTQEGKSLQVECHETLPSTHKLAHLYASSGKSTPSIIFSENQTQYNSLGEQIPEGKSEKGVYISCILRPSIFPSQAGFIRAMSAVALINALEEHTSKQLGIGWISDIFCENIKIGKVTIEGKLDNFASYEYIIISFAVKISDSDFPPKLSDLVKKVFEEDSSSIALIIAKNILSKFFALYPKRMKTPDKFMDVYRRKFALGGVKTKYFEDGKKKSCKILNVDVNDGTLMIEAEDGTIKHLSTNKSIIIPNKIKPRK